MKFIPLKPKQETQIGPLTIHTRSPFRITSIEKKGNDYYCTVFGDTAALGTDMVRIDPNDFVIPDAYRALHTTLIKDDFIDSSLLQTNQVSPAPEGEIIVGELLGEEANHYKLKIDEKIKYLYKPHFEELTAAVVVAQKGDELICQAALDLMHEFEGCKLAAYICPAGVPTIGWGNTRYPDNTKVKLGDTITQQKADEIFIAHLTNKCKSALEKIPTWDQMTKNQQGALYSFAYNLGSGFYGAVNFESITRVCDSPEKWNDKEWIAAQFVKYRDPGTKFEEGLRRRRLAEAELFCS